MPEEGKEVPVEDANQQPPAPEEAPVETPPADPEPITPAPAEPKEPIKREVHMMPVQKAIDEKKSAAAKARADADQEWQGKMDAQAADFQTKLQNATPVEQNTELKKWAEENDMDENAAAGLFNIIKNTLPQVDTSEYDAIVRDTKLSAQRAEVKTQIDTTVIDLIKKEHPGATPEQIERAASRVADLAFTAEYNSYPVADIYAVNKGSFDFEHGHAGEGDSGSTRDMVHYDSLTDTDIEKMTPEEYGPYSDYMASKGSRYTK